MGEDSTPLGVLTLTWLHTSHRLDLAGLRRRARSTISTQLLEQLALALDQHRAGVSIADVYRVGCEDVAELLAEVERLRAENTELRAHLKASG
jgi:hypothetical protein